MGAFEEHLKLMAETKDKMRHAKSGTAKRDLKKFYDKLVVQKREYIAWHSKLTK